MGLEDYLGRFVDKLAFDEDEYTNRIRPWEAPQLKEEEKSLRRIRAGCIGGMSASALIAAGATAIAPPAGAAVGGASVLSLKRAVTAQQKLNVLRCRLAAKGIEKTTFSFGDLFFGATSATLREVTGGIVDVEIHDINVGHNMADLTDTNISKPRLEAARIVSQNPESFAHGVKKGFTTMAAEVHANISSGGSPGYISAATMSHSENLYGDPAAMLGNKFGRVLLGETGKQAAKRVVGYGADGVLGALDNKKGESPVQKREILADRETPAQSRSGPGRMSKSTGYHPASSPASSTLTTKPKTQDRGICASIFFFIVRAFLVLLVFFVLFVAFAVWTEESSQSAKNSGSKRNYK
jgi:hypothetical protein